MYNCPYTNLSTANQRSYSYSESGPDHGEGGGRLRHIPYPENMYPYQTETDRPPENYHKASRLDPSLAYPVPLRPNSFERARFLDKMQPTVIKIKEERREREGISTDHLPDDPRDWSREDVEQWLRMMSEMYRISEVKPDRFQMNGKALCLMTVDMFIYRVPEGGNLLYHDFQRRLRSAVTGQ